MMRMWDSQRCRTLYLASPPQGVTLMPLSPLNNILDSARQRRPSAVCDSPMLPPTSLRWISGAGMGLTRDEAFGALHGLVNGI
jgi:hypothetical protein